MATTIEHDHSAFQYAKDSARSVFLAWERLRLVYNAVLFAVVILLAGPDLTDREFARFVFRGAFMANLCYCLGPVMEGYLSLLSIERRFARWLVFLPGQFIACFLAFWSVIAWQVKWD